MFLALPLLPFLLLPQEGPQDPIEPKQTAEVAGGFQVDFPAGEGGPNPGRRRAHHSYPFPP